MRAAGAAGCMAAWLGLLGLGAGCSAPPSHRDAGENGATAPARPDRIDPSLAVGDTVMGLVVAAREIRPSLADSGGWTADIRFQGEIEISGEYRPHFDYPEPSDVCFHPDSASARKLPRLPEDVRVSWFCFTNADTAAQLLGQPPARRRARIVVADFRYLYEHSDVYNTARLVRVLE